MVRSRADGPLRRAALPHARGPRALAAAQLGAAREVLRRRRERLRRSTSPSTPRSCTGAGCTTSARRPCSFLVAVTNNYSWNRLWTFRGQRGHVAYQGLRFLVVSLVALGGEPLVLRRARRARRRQDRRAGDRDRPGDAAQLRRQQALVVPRAPRRRLRPARRVVLRRSRSPAAAAARARPRRRRPRPATTRRAASSRRRSRRRSCGAAAPDRADEARRAIFLADPKVADWLDRYPTKDRATDATFDKDAAVDGERLVGRGGRDRDRARRRRDGAVTEAWTGPQVAWKMARGYPGAFGGTKINSSAGLARLLRALPARARRLAPPAVAAEPRPARAALVLASRSGSSTAATSSRACRSPTRRCVYLLGALVWIGWRGRPRRARSPGLAGLAARRGDGVPRRLPHRPERRAPRT